ncbi:hypothetical protein BZG36_02681 [Bifiguratus adelaidae]|uniref:Uncharacterized protein n=1 Tax=Bifiguratus adelaidae TaxID=1938954 RepID=A0A261Y1T9_9FUNG|nr:hypothetical protein BZG36_02681 [Bifiguratus adelaidae]
MADRANKSTLKRLFSSTCGKAPFKAFIVSVEPLDRLDREHEDQNPFLPSDRPDYPFPTTTLFLLTLAPIVDEVTGGVSFQLLAFLLPTDDQFQALTDLTLLSLTLEKDVLGNEEPSPHGLKRPISALLVDDDSVEEILSPTSPSVHVTTSTPFSSSNEWKRLETITALNEDAAKKRVQEAMTRSILSVEPKTKEPRQEKKVQIIDRVMSPGIDTGHGNSSQPTTSLYDKKASTPSPKKKRDTPEMQNKKLLMSMAIDVLSENGLVKGQDDWKRWFKQLFSVSVFIMGDKINESTFSDIDLKTHVHDTFIFLAQKRQAIHTEGLTDKEADRIRWYADHADLNAVLHGTLPLPPSVPEVDDPRMAPTPAKKSTVTGSIHKPKL